MKKKIIIFTLVLMIVAVILFFVFVLVLNVVNSRSALTGVTVVTKEEIIVDEINEDEIIEDETTAISEPLDIPETNDWGIIFTATDVTTTGLTIVCEQKDGEQQGELMTGSPYWLQVYENNSWETVEYTPQEYDVAWASEGWIVPLNDTIAWEVDWEWLYGELPSGTYRIGKSVMDLIEAGNFEEQTYYAEFKIE